MAERRVDIRVSATNDAGPTLAQIGAEFRELGSIPPARLTVELDPPKADPEFWRAVREDLAKEKLQVQVEVVRMQNLDVAERERFAGTEDAAVAAGALASKDALTIAEKLGGNLAKTLGRVARGATVVTAIIEGGNLFLQAGKLLTANIAGNYEDQVKAAKEAEEVVKGLPIIGSKILKLGKAINLLTIDRFTGESAYVEKLKEATAEQEKQIAVMEKRAARQKDNIRDAEATAKGVGADRDTSEEVAQRAKIDADKKALAEALKAEGLRGKDGKLTESGKAIEVEGLKRIQALELNLDDARLERGRQAIAEIEALRLAQEGKVAESERLKFQESLRQREVAAEKISANDLDNQKLINEEALKNFDREAKLKADADAKRAADEAAREEKKKADERRSAEIDAAEGKLDAVREREDALKEQGKGSGPTRLAALDQSRFLTGVANAARERNPDAKRQKDAADALKVLKSQESYLQKLIDILRKGGSGPIIISVPNTP